MPHLLVTDDHKSVCDAVADIAADEGYTVAQARDLRQARVQIDRRVPDMLVLDMCLPDGDGIEFWKKLRLPRTRVAFLTGHSSTDSAVEALRCGACDYLRKPVDLERVRTLLRDLKKKRVGAASAGTADSFARMIGASRAMASLRERIMKVARTRAVVLLVGESGTGKELVAEAVHQCSPRRAAPFLAINCGAISPSLVESELFGHEKGSFTGAGLQHKGYFERVHGGTIFLDEITEMPMAAQVGLLRVLETGRCIRVGSHVETRVDVRVVAATNRDPGQAVRDGVLRADLYHRLNVFQLVLPPLRERDGDILLIADHLLDRWNRENGTHKAFSPEARAAMADYGWPGNVRELRNYVYRCYVLADDVIERQPDDIFSAPPLPEASAEVRVPVGVPLADANRRVILATLRQCGGVRKLAARKLGISLKTLYNRLEEYRSVSTDGETDPAPRRDF